MTKTFDIVQSETPYPHNSGVNVSNVKSSYPALMYDDMVSFVIDWGQCESFNDTSRISEGIYSWFLLVEFSDVNIRDNNQNQLESNFELAKNLFHAKVLDGNRQVPECVWNFELNWIWYSILYPKNWLTDETIPERGIYKWAIINPELYFSDEAQNQVGDWSQRTGDILDWE